MTKGFFRSLIGIGLLAVLLIVTAALDFVVVLAFPGLLLLVFPVRTVLLIGVLVVLLLIGPPDGACPPPFAILLFVCLGAFVFLPPPALPVLRLAPGGAVRPVLGVDLAERLEEGGLVDRQDRVLLLLLRGCEARCRRHQELVKGHLPAPMAQILS